MISEPGHGRDVVDGLNDTDKSFIFILMATVQLPVSKRFDIHMVVHTATQNTDMSLALEFLNTCQMNHSNIVLHTMINTKKVK